LYKGNLSTAVALMHPHMQRRAVLMMQANKARACPDVGRLDKLPGLGLVCFGYGVRCMKGGLAAPVMREARPATVEVGSRGQVA
jgi:hypothetical protein